jgi:hypothetical protein
MMVDQFRVHVVYRFGNKASRWLYYPLDEIFREELCHIPKITGY